MMEFAGCKNTPAKETRLILLGKTGCGKSTLGNILLEKPDVKKKGRSLAPSERSEDQGAAVPTAGREDQGFMVGRGFGSATEKCGYKESMAWGRLMKVTDTPGFFDTAMDPGQLLLELSKVMSVSSPGPHAVLFVTRCDVRFTPEEYQAYEKIIDMFGEKIKQQLVLVFTRGDTLEGDTIEDLLEDPDPGLKKVMDTVRDNYAVISKTSDPAVREKEVKQLLEKIDWVSKNGQEYYTNDDLEKMTKTLVEETRKLMKDRNIGWSEAEYLLKKGIAEEDELFQGLHKKLIMMAVASTAFLVLAGLTGGIGTVLLAGATAAEAATGAGIATFASVLLTKVIELKAYQNLKAKFNRKDGSCTIL